MGTATSLRRLSSLALLVIPNLAPGVLLRMDKPWEYAPAVYCLGNGLWIAHFQWSRFRWKHDEDVAGVWLPCLLMTLGALSWGWLGEPIGTLNDGLAWDGQHYAAIYSYFSSGVYTPIVPAFPYSQRIALPFLAAHLPLPPRESFLLLDAVFWSATIVLFAICCRTCFKLTTAAIQFGVLWLQILWLSIPRGATTYSFTVDAAALFFIQAWICLLFTRRWRWLLPLCALVGVLFKETMLLVVLLSVVALCVMWIIPRFRRTLPADLSDRRSSTLAAVALAVIAGLIAKSLAAHALPHPDPGTGSAWRTMAHWLRFRAEDPWQVLRYVAATFSAYGGFALLAVATFGKPAAHDRGWEFRLAATLCALYFAICFVAGSDLTKFAFMAFPFAFPILLKRFDEVTPALAMAALVMGLPAAQAFTPIPSTVPGHDYPSQDLQGIYSWMMEYAHPAIVGSWMAWWLACILALRSIAFSTIWRPELGRVDTGAANSRTGDAGFGFSEERASAFPVATTGHSNKDAGGAGSASVTLLDSTTQDQTSAAQWPSSDPTSFSKKTN